MSLPIGRTARLLIALLSAAFASQPAPLGTPFTAYNTAVFSPLKEKSSGLRLIRPRGKS